MVPTNTSHYTTLATIHLRRSQRPLPRIVQCVYSIDWLLPRREYRTITTHTLPHAHIHRRRTQTNCRRLSRPPIANSTIRRSLYATPWQTTQGRIRTSTPRHHLCAIPRMETSHSSRCRMSHPSTRARGQNTMDAPTKQQCQIGTSRHDTSRTNSTTTTATTTTIPAAGQHSILHHQCHVG